MADLPDAAHAAARLGISAEAVAMARSCEVVDLHIDTFIPPRLWGYDPLRRHTRALAGRYFFGHLDLPRMEEGGLTGAMWSITTNVLRGPGGRWRVFQQNLAALRDLVDRCQGRAAIATTHRAYREARARGAHVVLPAIQGGNAVDDAPEGVASIPGGLITRATVVHLTNSSLGATSSPLGLLRRDKGLTRRGHDFVRACNRHRVFVDLAHIHRTAFWQAVAIHERSKPLLATHTGVAGVKPHWRNLDDDQVRAIADTGGTIGIIFSQAFLRVRGGPQDAAMVLDHMEHVIRVAGEDHVSIGSDFDGAIVPPPDLRSGETYPRLVQHMLDRRWSAARIEKVLGGNFLRCFQQLRPG